MTRARGTPQRARIGRRMTLEQWANLDEDVEGELVDGRLVEEEDASFAHEAIVIALAVTIDAWIDPRGGFVFGSGGKFALGPKLGRKADVSVFLPGGAVPPPYGAMSLPPDVMAEIISRTPRDLQRDRVEKKHEYAAFGVRFYWLIDPEARRMELFELDVARRYKCVVDASRGVVDVPGCPGLRLDLDALWAKIDRLGPPAPAAPRQKRKLAQKA
jgi:Uma2 family endonuclease